MKMTIGFCIKCQRGRDVPSMDWFRPGRPRCVGCEEILVCRGRKPKKKSKPKKVNAPGTAELLNPYRKRNYKLAAAGYQSYQEYLDSPLWAEIRARVLARDKHECVACGRLATCVHHTQYSGNVLFLTGDDRETPSAALVSMCSTCHRRIEFSGDGKKRRIADVMKELRHVCLCNNRTLPGRCQGCMKGSGSKADGLCAYCRRKRGSTVPVPTAEATKPGHKTGIAPTPPGQVTTNALCGNGECEAARVEMTPAT